MIIDVSPQQLQNAKKLCPSNYSIQIDKLSHDFFVNLAQSGLWPKAVNQHRIITNESEKQYRAKCILFDLLDFDLQDQRLLDFGCGDGHLVQEALKRGANAIGYDPNTTCDNDFITNDINIIEKNSKYNILIMYDTIDHILNNAYNIFIKIANMVHKDGKIIIRTHPFTSIHGTHLYESLNLAYVHLFLTQQQIIKLGGKPLDTLQLYNPEAFYEKMIFDAGTVLIDKKIVRTELPKFIDQNDVLDYLLQVFALEGIDTRQKLRNLLSIQFIDYYAMKL